MSGKIDINTIRENNHHMSVQSLDIFVLWMLKVMSETFKLNRAVFFKWSQQKDNWINLIDIIDLGLSQMPGSSIILDEIPHVSNLKLKQWNWTFVSKMKLDAIYAFKVSDSIYMIGISKKEKVTYNLSEQKELGDFADYIDEALQKKYEYEPEHRVFRKVDKLTSIGNRFDLVEFIRGESFNNIPDKSLVIADIDKLARINSEFGFRRTDKVVKLFANMLNLNIHSRFYRVGLSAFAGVMFGRLQTVRDCLLNLSDYWDNVLSHEFDNMGRLTFSVGVCSCKNNLPIEEVWKRADAALRVAKQTKPGEICFARSDCALILSIEDVGPVDFPLLLKELVPADASTIFERDVLDCDLLIDEASQRLS